MCKDLLFEEDVIVILQKSVEKEGSQDRFASRHYFSAALVSLTLAGKIVLGPLVLDALGLEKVVMYRRKEYE